YFHSMTLRSLPTRRSSDLVARRSDQKRLGALFAFGGGMDVMAAEPLTSYKEDVTVRLLTTFKRLLSEGTLISGSRLPAERELADKFHVSRSSLRQALKVLEIIGVISQRV